MARWRLPMLAMLALEATSCRIGFDFDGGATDAAIDAMAACDEVPCGLVGAQCGCPEGLACQRPRDDDPSRECIAPGDRRVGETCARNGDCVAAVACVIGLGSVGMCELYCASSSDCGPDTICRELLPATEDIGSCVTACDPVANTGCPTPLGCALVLTRTVPERAFVDAVTCTAGGPVAGESCAVPICAGGHKCVGGICLRVCDPALGCATGTCRPFPDPIVIDGRELGYCE